jgi:hypothetical protein
MRRTATFGTPEPTSRSDLPDQWDGSLSAREQRRAVGVPRGHVCPLIDETFVLRNLATARALLDLRMRSR